MTTKKPGQCDRCIYRYQNLKGTFCEAFPVGIPSNIFSDEIKHDHPIKGDNGIQFELDPKQTFLEG